MAIQEIERLAKLKTSPWLIEGDKPGLPLNNPNKAWVRVKKRAKSLLEEEGLADEGEAILALRIHDLRHSYASFAILAGVPLGVVGKALGHSSNKTTERYTHIADDPARRAADAVADEIDRLTGGPAKIIDLTGSD